MKFKRFLIGSIIISFILLLTACTFSDFEVNINFVVDDQIYYSIKINEESIIELPEAPQKEGFEFEGWFLDKDEWNEPLKLNFLFDSSVRVNFSVYARWKTLEEIEITNFFAAYRQERLASRQVEIEYLDLIITGENSTAELISQALEKKFSIIQAVEKELVAEALIISRGFEDCVVVYSASKISVLIKDANMTEEKAQFIVDIITIEFNVDKSTIIVVPIE